MVIAYFGNGFVHKRQSPKRVVERKLEKKKVKKK